MKRKRERERHLHVLHSCEIKIILSFYIHLKYLKRVHISKRLEHIC